MKKFMVISFVTVLALSFAFSPEAEAVRFYSFGTASTAGTWYIIGAGFSSHINKHYPEVKVTAEVTAGSLEDYYLLKRKQMDISLTTPDILADDLRENAYGGKAKEKVRIVMWSYHTSDKHLIVRKESPIKDICDIKGKKVGVGPHGTIGMISFLRTFKSVCGYEPDKDYKALYYTYGECQTGIRDNTIDLGVTSAGHPVASVMDLTTSVKVRLISMTDAQVKTYLNDWPLQVKTIIPAGTYRGIDYDVLTTSSSTGIICRPDIPEKDIYGIVKALFTDVEDRNVFHPMAKRYALEATLDFAERFAKKGIALHPGTVKYLKEIGAWKPEFEVAK